jgi:hypothetical protein
MGAPTPDHDEARMARECPEPFIFRQRAAAMIKPMFITPTAHRPAMPPETLRGMAGVEAPLVALFDTAENARAAVRSTGARLLRDASPGVVMVAPASGLRERLYAAGAMLVVG